MADYNEQLADVNHARAKSKPKPPGPPPVCVKCGTVRPDAYSVVVVAVRPIRTELYCGGCTPFVDSD